MALDEAERKLFDLREGIDVALGLLGASLGDRIRVVREYPEALPAVLCSPAKLNRAFLSILQNAVQAIEGNGEIRVTVREREGASRSSSPITARAFRRGKCRKSSISA